MKYCEECTRLVLRYGRKNLDFDCDDDQCEGAVDDMDDVSAICDYVARTCELVKLREDNQRLREALEALVQRWETPSWKDAPATANYIAIAKAVLAQLEGE